MSELDDQLAALAAMSTKQIMAEWERVFRQPAPCLSPDLMERALAYRLQERVIGGLPAATKRELTRIAKHACQMSGSDDRFTSAKPSYPGQDLIIWTSASRPCEYVEEVLETALPIFAD